MAADALTFILKNDAGSTVRTFYHALHKFDATVPPTPTDDDADGYIGGSVWVDRTHNRVYVCADNATGAAIWREVGDGLILIDSGTETVDGETYQNGTLVRYAHATGTFDSVDAVYVFEANGETLTEGRYYAADFNEVIDTDVPLYVVACCESSGGSGGSGSVTSWKDSCRAATHVAGTFASSFDNGSTVDGVSLVTGDRILIKNQAAGAENGIYVVAASGAPTRATDADTEALLLGAVVHVREGTVNHDCSWRLFNDTLTVDTTSQVWQWHAGGNGLDYQPEYSILTVGNIVGFAGFVFTTWRVATQLVANTNDWAPYTSATAQRTLVIVDSDAAYNITGIDAGNANNGAIFLVNNGAFPLKLTNQDTASTAANRFQFGGRDIVLRPQTGIHLQLAVTGATFGWYCLGITPAISGLFDHYADAGNTGTGEDDLYSDSVAASTLLLNGDKLIADYSGQFVGHATATRQVRVYFGGTAIYDSTAQVSASNADWDLSVKIVRESATVVRCGVRMITAVSGILSTQYTRVTGLTLSSANVLKVTGEAAAAGAATNDIVAKFSSVRFGGAA